jgi:catechol 2,3-dioxygenase-like lactoylglutathione lyase family enzyme
MQIRGTHHVAIYTRNLAQLRQFYVEVLELEVVGSIKRPDINILFVGVGDTALEIVERKTGDSTGRGEMGWAHIAFEVADLDQAVAGLQQQGIEFHILPRDFPAERPAMRLAFCKDPDGNDVELLQPLGSRYPAESI